MAKKIKKISGIVSGVLIALLALAVVYNLYCNISNKVAYIGGYAAIRIISPSMKPTIPTNEYILVEKADTSKIEVNDVIVFYSKDPSIYGKLNTHRVVEIAEENGKKVFTTKGDNNSARDSYKVSESDVSGKYIKNLPFITKTFGFFKHPMIFFGLIIIPALILVVLAIRDVKKGVDSVKHQKLVEKEIRKLELENFNKEEGNNVQKAESEKEDKEVQEGNKPD